MLLKFYRGTGLAGMLIIFITAAGLWTGPVFNREIPVYNPGLNTMPLFTLLNSILGNNSTAAVLFAFGFVILISVLLVNFNTADFFISERTFLPATIYIIISGILPYYQAFNPALIASLFLILSLIRIMEAYKKNGTAYNFFDAAILLSTGSLFYAGLLWVGLFLFISIIMLRSNNIKELLISIIGFLTPYILLYGIYYVIGKDLTDLSSLINANLFGESGHLKIEKISISALITVGIFMLFAVFHLFTVFNSKKIKARKTFSLLLWILFLSAGSFVLLPSVADEIVYIVAIPVSYLISHFSVFMKKKFIPDIFFTVILILVILSQIFYFK